MDHSARWCEIRTKLLDTVHVAVRLALPRIRVVGACVRTRGEAAELRYATCLCTRIADENSILQIGNHLGRRLEWWTSVRVETQLTLSITVRHTALLLLRCTPPLCTLLLTVSVALVGSRMAEMLTSPGSTQSGGMRTYHRHEQQGEQSEEARHLVPGSTAAVS